MDLGDGLVLVGTKDGSGLVVGLDLGDGLVLVGTKDGSGLAVGSDLGDGLVPAVRVEVGPVPAGVLVLVGEALVRGVVGMDAEASDDRVGSGKGVASDAGVGSTVGKGVGNGT